MSSTNRGYERHKTDYYVTPKWCINDFLSEWLSDLQEGEDQEDLLNVGGRPDRARWFDPCCGGDANHEASYPAVLQKAFEPNTLQTLDVREDSKANEIGDYLWYDIKGLGERPQVIITNPPFYCAKEIIEKALTDVADNGYVVMLLRLNFFGSKARKPFFDRQLPIWSYVHNRRMSFTDDGKTDSIEYCHMVWQQGRCPDFTMLKII